MEEKRKQNLYEIASTQKGYFTAKQATAAGYSYRMHTHYTKSGEWLKFDRGLFRLVRFPESPFEDLVIISLWSMDRKGVPKAVISHESALTVHELGDVMPSRIHITVPPGFRKKRGGCVIHRGVVTEKELEKREGYNITSVPRAILDCTQAGMDIDHLEKVVDQALRIGLTRIIDIVSMEMAPKTREIIMQVLKNVSNV